jgi:hypothetical protein
MEGLAVNNGTDHVNSGPASWPQPSLANVIARSFAVSVLTWLACFLEWQNTTVFSFE